MKKKVRTYKSKFKKNSDGSPPSSPKFTEEHKALASVMPGELSMGEDGFDSLLIQEGHPLSEAGNPIADATLSKFIIV